MIVEEPSALTGFKKVRMDQRRGGKRPPTTASEVRQYAWERQELATQRWHSAARDIYLMLGSLNGRDNWQLDTVRKR